MSEIIVEHLSRRVRDADGWLSILDDVTFTIPSGATAAIVGASGSGKSTLLGLLAGLDLPDAGRVMIGGQSLFDLDEDARAAWRARHIGFVFQTFQLLGQMTALENIMLPLELAGEPRAEE
ncbi:MAG TPA: ATP-binding cassette domain-containing protein, partial [Burkholderiaceae bacterium]|nr:ATP-binding cassette domain-containing protein [Burkholderiaceae bacterium]